MPRSAPLKRWVKRSSDAALVPPRSPLIHQRFADRASCHIETKQTRAGPLQYRRSGEAELKPIHPHNQSFPQLAGPPVLTDGGLGRPGGLFRGGHVTRDIALG